MHGEPFFQNSTSVDSWTCLKHSPMAVSLPQKKGRMRRKDQKGQRNEVDGGGRRQRCSSGKPPGLCVPIGGHAARKNDRKYCCPAPRQRTPTEKSQTLDCRRGLWRR